MASLTAVALVCRRQPQHAPLGARISSFLDASARVSSDEALVSRFASLLQRVVARELTTAEPLAVHHWVWRALQREIKSSTASSAAETNSLKMVQCLASFIHPSRSLWDVVAWAVDAKRLELVQWLYIQASTKQGGAPAEAQDRLLSEAVGSGDVAIVQWILDQRVGDIAYAAKKKPVDFGSTVKAIASGGDTAQATWTIVELLIERLGMLPHRSLPVLAARHGRLDTIQKIQTHVSSAVALFGTAAANAAASKGHFDVVERLGVMPTSDAMDEAALDGDVAILTQLHRRFQCQASAVAALRAADNGHLHALAWLHDTFGSCPFWNDLDALLLPAFTAAVERGHLPVVTWLYETLLESMLASKPPQERRIVDAVSVYLAFQHDHFPVIQFLHTHGLMDWDNWEGGNAAYYCDLPTILWLQENNLLGEPRNELTSAVAGGRIDCIRWILDNRTLESATHAVEYAALHGRTDVLSLLLAKGVTSSFRAIDYAASKGHVDTIRQLLAHRPTVFADETALASVAAIQSASLAGHLEVVRLLTEQPVPGGTCTTTAMDSAAGKGFFDVVQYLHTNRTEGCTFSAMDAAATNGSMEIVRFLHENRSEGCSAAALEGSAVNGHFGIVQFLATHYSHTFTPKVVQRARAKGELEIALWLEQSSAALAVAVAVAPRRASRNSSSLSTIVPPATPILA